MLSSGRFRRKTSNGQGSRYGRQLSNNSPGWRPFTLSNVVLTSIIIITIILILVLALLLWRNAQFGGVMVAAGEDGFSDFQVFLFRYLPVIITVLYGLFWGMLDLDIKRLEPYYQLSRPDAVSARESLFLQYPSTFFAFVPYISAKAGHWTVFAISMISIITNWAAIPFQNGMFVAKYIELNESTQSSQPYQLTTLANQRTRLSAAFLRDTSNVIWLGQPLPSFTTSGFALAPVDFEPDATGLNRTIRVNTTLYEMDMKCKPPLNISISENYYIFADGDGCNTQELIPQNSTSTIPKFEAWHVAHTHGEFTDPRFSFSLSDTDCPGNNKIFVAWRRTTSSGSNFYDPKNATALFCSASYFHQEVEATIKTSDHTVDHIERKAHRQLLTEAEFNQTRFEYIAAIGGGPFTEERTAFGSKKLGQESFITNMTLLVPIQTMVGLAIGSTHLPADAYLNATTLAIAYETAYRLAFSLAIRYLMDPSDNPKASPASTSALFQVVTTVKIFVVLVQSTLAILILLSAFLLFNAPRRFSRLERDPDCISENMLLTCDPTVRRAVRTLFSREIRLAQPGYTHRFTLEKPTPDHYPALAVSGNNHCAPFGTDNKVDKALTASSNMHTDLSNDQAAEPLEYKWYVGLGFSISIGIVLASLIAIQVKSTKQNGLALPKLDETVLQLLTNVLPTLLASSIEPIWIWITRMTCILTPIENLQRKDQPAKRSLMLRYASLPPQLAAWQAIRNSNYMLGILSIVTFTAGMLTVAVSGIFVISSTPMVELANLTTLVSAQIQDSVGFLDFDDTGREYWVALPNVTNHTTLPTWISPHNFFLPLRLDGLLGRTNITALDMKVPGYSVDPQCSPLLPKSGADDTYELIMANNATQMNFSTSHRVGDGTVVRCVPTFSDASSDEFFARLAITRFAGDPAGSQLARVGHALRPLAGTTNQSFSQSDITAGTANTLCDRMLIFGGIRLNATLISNAAKSNSTGKVSNSTSKMDVSSTFMVCKPKPVTRMFNITISTTGSILSAIPLDNISENLPGITNISSIVQGMIERFNSASGLSGSLSWRNDSIATTLSDDLQRGLTSSASFLDASLPLAPIDTQIPIVGDLIQRIYVISLRLSLRRFKPAPPDGARVPVQIRTLERRIFLSPLSFKLSVAILSTQLLVAMIFFFSRPRPFLKRLPTNLAAQISMFANSHVVDDVISAARGDFHQLDSKGWRYGYGRFIGLDGRVDEGIERNVFLTKLGRRATGFERSWSGLLKSRRTKQGPSVEKVEHRSASSRGPFQPSVPLSPRPPVPPKHPTVSGNLRSNSGNE